MAKITEMDDGTQALTSLRVPEDADVVVMQRPARALQVQMVQMMRANGIAVVIDMDDDMSSLHPENIAYYVYKPGSSSGMDWRVTEKVCREATLVTTSTRKLLRMYAKHGRGRVIDNFVPAAYLDFNHYDTGNFGWAGTTKSHPNDLQVMGRAVQQLIDEGHRFRVVGGPSRVKQVLRLTDEVDAVGPVDLQAWARTICQNLDVSLCPLAATAFNESKSRLKPLESMAVGVPWVASPREEYRRLHRESGCGLLANTPKEWVQAVRTLMASESLRKEQADKGKAYMETQTYQAQAWQWMEAWEEALKIQRGGS